MLNCKVDTSLTTYMGLLFGASSKDLAVWNPVIEKVVKWPVG